METVFSDSTQVSVCMATFNGEQFIERQLRSILQQLRSRDELIISDDGSTDNTEAIITGIRDSRIRVCKNQGRKGPVGNFENALREASGKFIVLSDQDDVWLPGKMDAVLYALKQADLVLTDCRVVNRHHEILWPSFFKHRGSAPGFLRNLLKNSYVGCCMAFRREVLLYALPFPKHIHMHDWWIGLLVEAKGRIVFLHEPMIEYVRHGSNASPTGETSYSVYRQFVNRLMLLLNLVPRLLMTSRKS